MSASLPLRPPPHPPGVPAVQIGLPGPLEGRKELLEPLRAQAGERLERAGGLVPLPPIPTASATAPRRA